ncbi:MAG: 4Fe-4S binding protein [Burkholderiales bacterium]|nr:4Fe-4S binding protein [Burkholderiales bacterium]
MRQKPLLCNCNQTMQVDGKKIAGALGITDTPAVQSEMCRQHLAAFEAAVKSGDDLLVACTQEAPLFTALHAELGGAGAIGFVNIRETAGWSDEGRQAAPKMAALLAAADVPDPEPVPTVSYEAGSELLIIGPGAAILPWAERLAEQLSVTVLMTDAGRGAELPAERRYPVYSGQIKTLDGYLGAFNASWEQHNPIDLDACTRCGACIEVCPEQAIDFSYQIDLDKCKSHRKCVTACGSVGAIDFDRPAVAREDRFDLVLDLSAVPQIRLHQPPQGYLAPGKNPLEQALAVAKLTQLTGVFEKPKFFVYKEKICAHARSEITGCTACIDVCSTGAISSLLKENRVAIEPHLCMGCGGCATVCPSGAMTYAYPRVADVGVRLKAALKAYTAAGGRNPRLLFHNNSDGRALVTRLGRQGRGLPADMIPIEVLHVAAIGLDLLLGSLALGAAQVVILAAGSEASGYAEATGRQIALGEDILQGFGYETGRLHWVDAGDLRQAEQALWGLKTPPSLPAAGFNLSNEKRSSLDFVFDHLHGHAPRKVDAIVLKSGAPFGAIAVDAGKCTLCMACVGACPEGALLDSKEAPALRLIEKNCVQCGLCVRTCPEQALALQPRLMLTPQAKTARTINEAQAFGCIKCGKPFGTKQMVDGMLTKLGKHSMFAEPGALDRIKMCADCRVIDLLQTSRHGNINDV